MEETRHGAEYLDTLALSLCIKAACGKHVALHVTRDFLDRGRTQGSMKHTYFMYVFANNREREPRMDFSVSTR
jgi:hypothetical protein